MKIAFDIGGVLTRHTAKMKEIMATLERGGAEVHVVTDMPLNKAMDLCIANGITDIIPISRIHSADWDCHQELCKTILCEELGIEALFDDHGPYLHTGNFIGFLLTPRPSLPYYSNEWKCV